MVGRDIFSLLGPALGRPELKSWLSRPLPLFMAVSMIPKVRCPGTPELKQRVVRKKMREVGVLGLSHRQDHRFPVQFMI